MPSTEVRSDVRDVRVRGLHFEATLVNALDSTNEDKFDEDYVDHLMAGGIDVVNVTVPWPEDDFGRAVTSYGNWRRRLAALGNRVRVVRDVADIAAAKEAGQVGVILGFQNSNPIEDDLSLVRVWHELGVRIVQLTYNRRNFVGSGVAERSDPGLSLFGQRLVGELQRIGIVVDLAHVGHRTALDAVAVARRPVALSHVAAQARCGHFRCVSDELIAAVAQQGGCIGVAALSLLLRDDALTSGASLADYLDHLEHVIDIAGIDHVGIGFDVGFKRTDGDSARLEGTYPEFRFPPLHLRYASELSRADLAPNLTEGLVARGYDDDEIRKLLGLNWLRLFGATWA